MDDSTELGALWLAWRFSNEKPLTFFRSLDDPMTWPPDWIH
jgi:hypothetical protein